MKRPSTPTDTDLLKLLDVMYAAGVHSIETAGTLVAVESPLVPDDGVVFSVGSNVSALIQARLAGAAPLIDSRLH